MLMLPAGKNESCSSLRWKPNPATGPFCHPSQVQKLAVAFNFSKRAENGAVPVQKLSGKMQSPMHYAGLVICYFVLTS